MIDLSLPPYSCQSGQDITTPLRNAMAEHRGAELFLPAGDYTLAPYTWFWTVKLRGENYDAIRRTRLVAATPGPYFLLSAARCVLEDIVLDAAGCADGITMTNAHVSMLRNVDVTGAVNRQFNITNCTQLMVERCAASGGEFCWRIAGCNGSQFSMLASAFSPVGMEWCGKGLDSSLAAGSSALIGYVSQNCDRGLDVRGAHSATFRDMYIEAATSDGVRLRDVALNIHVERASVTGGGGYAYNVENVSRCELRRCGADGSESFRRIRDVGSGTVITECYRLTPSGPPLEVVSE